MAQDELLLDSVEVRCGLQGVAASRPVADGFESPAVWGTIASCASWTSQALRGSMGGASLGRTGPRIPPLFQSKTYRACPSARSVRGLTATMVG